MTATNLRRAVAAAIGTGLGSNLVVGQVAAQAGGDLCGTPIEAMLNEFGPLVIGALIIAGAFVSMIAHGMSGLHKDPDTVRFYRKWRNRSALTAVSVPVVGYFIEVALGLVGVGLAGCIDLVPFL